MDDKQSHLIPTNQYAVFASVCVCHVQKGNGMMYKIKQFVVIAFMFCASNKTM